MKLVYLLSCPAVVDRLGLVGPRLAMLQLLTKRQHAVAYRH